MDWLGRVWIQARVRVWAPPFAPHPFDCPVLPLLCCYYRWLTWTKPPGASVRRRSTVSHRHPPSSPSLAFLALGSEQGQLRVLGFGFWDLDSAATVAMSLPSTATTSRRRSHSLPLARLGLDGFWVLGFRGWRRWGTKKKRTGRGSCRGIENKMGNQVKARPFQLV